MDWKKNRLLVGVGVLVVLLGITIWAFRARNAEPEDGAGEQDGASLPDLDKDEIDELVITRPENPPVRLAKREGKWFVVEPVEAAADETVVNAALDKLDELEVIRVASSNSENHERLEVDDEHGIRVVVRAGGQDLASLIIGKSTGGNTMVRRVGEDQVMSVRGSLTYAFNKELKDWRDRRILDEPPEDIIEMSFRDEHGAWRFVRNAEDAWVQAEGETPIERFAATKIQGIASTLARLRAVNFAASDVTVEAAGLGETAAVATLVIRPHREAPAAAGEEGEGEEGEGETPAPAGENRTIVLRVGGSPGEGEAERYLQREGDATIYVVARYGAEKILVNVESFQTPPPPAPGEEPEEPPDMPAMPPGAGGGGQIPPELMRQIQQQLQQQGGGQ